MADNAVPKEIKEHVMTNLGFFIGGSMFGGFVGMTITLLMVAVGRNNKREDKYIEDDYMGASQ